MVKPIQSLLLLSYILIALILISFLFPTTNKLHLIYPTINAKGDTIDEGFSVKFFTSKDIFIKNKATESKDIGATVALAEKLKTMSKTKIEVKDTLVVQNDSLSKDTLPILDIAAIQQLLSEKYRIQFPDDNPIALHAFFKALNHLKQDSTLIRILHYGDSQIEGDHITGQLRKNFQTQFGGSGVGLLPVFDAAPKSTIACKKSPNWFNYLIFGNKYDKNFPANYGILGSYFSYTPMPKSNADSLFKPVLSDSLTLLKLQQNSKLHQGWFSVEKGWRKDSKINNFNQLTLLYGNVYTPAYVQITTKKDTLIRFLMQPSRSLHLKKIPFKGEL